MIAPLRSPAPPDRNGPVLILGAGPAGLAAAWELAEAGAPVRIVEAEPAPGGLCRSFEKDGFFFDQGGHRFITRHRELFDRVRALLGERLRVRERESAVRIRGRDYSYPLDPVEILRGEGFAAAARIAGSYLFSKVDGIIRRPFAKEPRSLDGWIRGRFGGEIFRRFFGDYTRKLWGVGAEEISAEWAGKRIAGFSARSIIEHALGIGGRRPRTFASKYAYPKHGIGEIFTAIAERLRTLGGVLSLSTRAVRIRPGPPLEADLLGPAGEETVRCGRILSTIPLPELVRILDAPAGVIGAAESLRFRSLRFLNLLLDGPDLSTKTWIYVPESRYLMTRVQFPSRRSPENCPVARTSVQLEIPCDHGDGVWSAADGDLLDRGLADLKALGWDVSGRLLGSFTTSARHAYPIHDVAYSQKKKAIIDWLGGMPGIETFGRQGGFNYIFFDRAMEDGIAAARRFLGKPEPLEAREDDPLLPDEARSIIGMRDGPSDRVHGRNGEGR